jgi:hypothetical protein
MLLKLAELYSYPNVLKCCWAATKKRVIAVAPRIYGDILGNRYMNAKNPRNIAIRDGKNHSMLLICFAIG